MPDRSFDLLRFLDLLNSDVSGSERESAEHDDAQAAISNRHVASLSGDELVERVKQIIYRHAQVVQVAGRGPTTAGERALLVVLRDFEGGLVETLHWLIANGHARDIPVGDDTLVFSMNGMLFGRVLDGEESSERHIADDDELWSSGGDDA